MNTQQNSKILILPHCEPRKHLSNDIVVKFQDFQQFSAKMLTHAKIVMS